MLTLPISRPMIGGGRGAALSPTHHRESVEGVTKFLAPDEVPWSIVLVVIVVDEVA